MARKMAPRAIPAIWDEVRERFIVGAGWSIGPGSGGEELMGCSMVVEGVVDGGLVVVGRFMVNIVVGKVATALVVGSGLGLGD